MRTQDGVAVIESYLGSSINGRFNGLASHSLSSFGPTTEAYIVHDLEVVVVVHCSKIGFYNSDVPLQDPDKMVTTYSDEVLDHLPEQERILLHPINREYWGRISFFLAFHHFFVMEMELIAGFTTEATMGLRLGLRDEFEQQRLDCSSGASVYSMRHLVHCHLSFDLAVFHVLNTASSGSDIIFQNSVFELYTDDKLFLIKLDFDYSHEDSEQEGEKPMRSYNDLKTIGRSITRICLD
ncbi:hypothetical protein Tco_1363211 [Tanacetum coccineum]